MTYYVVSPSGDGASVYLSAYPWSCHTLGGCLSGPNLSPGTEVPSAIGQKEESRQVLETRGERDGSKMCRTPYSQYDTGAYVVSVKPGSQYDAGAYVASVYSLVHNMTLELT